MSKFLFLLLCLSVSGCAIVSPGERGVRISLGKVSDDVKDPGAYFWIPGFLGMAKMNVQIQKAEIVSSAASKDMQEVKALVAVNWSLSPDKVINTYKNIGDEYYVEKLILTPAVNEVIKAATAKRAAEELLTKRMELKKDIDVGLAERLSQYGITFHDVSIVDLKFSAGFIEAIEHKQIAEQQAKQASYVAEKATQDARADVERAKGQAEAQRLTQASTTAAILQQRAIEKWDGKFPQVMSSGTLPFVNFNIK